VGLRPAQAAIGADIALESQHLPGFRVVGTVDIHIGRIGEAAGAAQMLGSSRPEARERILPLDGVPLQIVDALLSQRHRSVGLRLYEQKADALVRDQARNHLRDTLKGTTPEARHAPVMGYGRNIPAGSTPWLSYFLHGIPIDTSPRQSPPEVMVPDHIRLSPFGRSSTHATTRRVIPRRNMREARNE
jgi:hypothetical protein